MEHSMVFDGSRLASPSTSRFQFQAELSEGEAGFLPSESNENHSTSLFSFFDGEHPCQLLSRLAMRVLTSFFLDLSNFVAL